jgi:two-component sensor histidine kinase
MSGGPDGEKPLVESPPDGETSKDPTQRPLRQRIRQQELLARLGVFALQGAPFDERLDETAKLTAEGMQAEFCKVMEYEPAQNRLIVRAGVGWHSGVIGVASVGADLASPAGFALKTGKPVISNHLENEQRFRTPELLVEHGIHRAINVILQGDGSPFGVLEVDSRSEGEFGESDIAFLQGAANILGTAIERKRRESLLKAALDRHEVLLKEINHRAKNSLQVVASMLQLQSNAAGNAELTALLREAATRVVTVGRAYERLAYDGDNEKIDLGSYLQSVARDLEITASPCSILFKTETGILLSSDRAILLALIVNELVTNCAKYAYPGGAGGKIWVNVARDGTQAVLVAVRDEGVGMPADVKLGASKRLGSRIITTPAKQLDAELIPAAAPSGTEFRLRVQAEKSGNP